MDVPKFVKDVPNFPKHVSRWGLPTNHFLIGSQIKLWALGDKMGVPQAIEWGVPNFLKDVPNFVKDVPTVPKRVLRWGSTANHFFMGPKMKLWIIHVQMGVSEAIGSDVPNLIKDVPNFVKDVRRVPKYVLRWRSAPKHFLMGF